MIKTFPHAVIWKGEFVRANTPIEIDEEPVKVEPKKVDTVKVEKVDTVENTTTTEKPKRKGGKKNDKAGDRES